MSRLFMFDSKKYGPVCIQARNTEGANTAAPDPERPGIFRIYRVKDVDADHVTYFQAFPESEQERVGDVVMEECSAKCAWLYTKVMQARAHRNLTFVRLTALGIEPSRHPDYKKESNNLADAIINHQYFPQLLDIMTTFHPARNDNNSIPMMRELRDSNN